VNASAYILRRISLDYFNTEAKVCSLSLVVMRRITRGSANWTHSDSIQDDDMSQRINR